MLMNFRAFSSFQYAMLAFALLLILLHLLPDSIRSVLEYHRSQPAQIWRALTGHLLHSNHWHLVMNLGALLLMLMLHQLYYQLSSFALLLLSGCIGISVLLYLFSPDIQIYLGLSGWLHCFITVGALLDIKHKIHSGWLILLGVIAKVGYEQWQGPDQELAALIDANVAIDAHFYGVICGLLLGLLFVISAKPAESQVQH
ncbi:rhombosortase [Rheinheimera sediminis]|uniref:rhombosortase n=1 Tax=Rheinheimera sp. YQF-1 TaxID=2499626 RepID=UPI0021BDD559|nr:rhombosortase [Rheinheimera sp. YQF-1]